MVMNGEFKFLSHFAFSKKRKQEEAVAAGGKKAKTEEGTEEDKKLKVGRKNWAYGIPNIFVSIT